MSAIVSIIVLASVILLLYALLLWSSRRSYVASEALERDLHPRRGGENHPLADESPLPPEGGDSRRTQQPEPDPGREEKVTLSLTEAPARTRCPACGAAITSNDETCPSCEIAFVADASQKWTPGTVGPADGIYRPPTEVSE